MKRYAMQQRLVEVTTMLLRQGTIFLCSLLVGWWMVGSPALAADSKVQAFTLEIHHRKVSSGMEVIRVQQGDKVTLRWTTDERVEIHLHGYDIEKVVKPGVPVEFTFEAYATGRYPITAHGFGEHSHGQKLGETPLVYLEVLPR
jgi:plastocyanin